MGVSSVGQRMSARTIRFTAAAVLVMLGLFYYLYGPPLTQAFQRAAERECVRLTGENYRTYRLEWKSTWFGSLAPPHWSCTDLRQGEGLKQHDLGWWVSP
jgi:hypothetical protein